MTPDPYYNSDCDLFLGIDKGFRNPNVTLWIQPDRKMERVIVLFAHYQVLRTPDENAKIALEIHKARGYGQLTGGWGEPSAPEGGGPRAGLCPVFLCGLARRTMTLSETPDSPKEIPPISRRRQQRIREIQDLFDSGFEVCCNLALY